MHAAQKSLNAIIQNTFNIIPHTVSWELCILMVINAEILLFKLSRTLLVMHFYIRCIFELPFVLWMDIYSWKYQNNLENLSSHSYAAIFCTNIKLECSKGKWFFMRYEPTQFIQQHFGLERHKFWHVKWNRMAKLSEYNGLHIIMRATYMLIFVIS